MTERSDTGSSKPWPEKIYQPLGLDPWSQVFHQDGSLAYSHEPLPADSFARQLHEERRSSYQLAMEVADQTVTSLTDEELREVATTGLMTTLTDQAGRNGKYNTAIIRNRLYQQYDAEDYAAILYGTARPEQLAQTVIENDDQLVSLEVARHSHVNQWEYEQDVNLDVRRWLAEAPLLGAEQLTDAPRYKIKGFFERAVLVERKRHVMALLGGTALVVMRLNFLLDKKAADIPHDVRRHIAAEEAKLGDRRSPRYDFNAENELLCSQLDNRYIRRLVSDDKPDFVVPLQTGYYVYSPDAHAGEKQAEQAELQRLRDIAPDVKHYWSQDW